MHASRYKRINAWIALAAMLLGVVSSTHAGWRVHPRDGLPVDLCSTSGVAPGSDQDGSGAPPPRQAAHDDHCWFCTKPGAATVLLDRRPAPAFGIAASAPPPLYTPVLSAGFPPHHTPPTRAPPRLV